MRSARLKTWWRMRRPTLQARESTLSISGFVALPTELLLEIVSHFPPVKVTIGESAPRALVRRHMLQPLSAVCHRFRQVFRPCLWQRMEVLYGLRIGNRKLDRLGDSETRTKLFTKELLRQLNVVTVQDPDLAQQVRVVDIVIRDSGTRGTPLRPVFEKLGRSFSLFPNLHTVKIIWEGYYEDLVIERTFPQIRSAILSDFAFPLLLACPNLESLAISNNLPRDSGYPNLWPKLQKLYMKIYTLDQYLYIGEHFSSLRELTVIVHLPTWEDFRDSGALINFIRKLKSLETLNLV